MLMRFAKDAATLLRCRRAAYATLRWLMLAATSHCRYYVCCCCWRATLIAAPPWLAIFYITSLYVYLR